MKAAESCIGRKVRNSGDPELLSDTVGKQEALNRPWENSVKRWKDWSVLKTNPRDESRKSKAAYVITAVVLCVSVCACLSLVFPPCGKKSSDSENRSVCLSCQCSGAVRLSKQ